MDLQRSDKTIISFTSLFFLASILFLRFSGFSVSSIVNFYNHIIKSVIFSANTDTFGALSQLLKPFAFVVVALIFFTLAISLLAYYGCKSERSSLMAGKLSGAVGALMSIVFFPTVAGAFLAVAMLACGFYAPRFSAMYEKEVKKWAHFRIGSNTAGKMLLVVNIIIAVGVFSSVLLQQNQYDASFRQELKDSVRTLALSLPGASSMSPEAFDQRVESTTNSLTGSKFFSAYIVWLPVSAAFTTWIVLEFLRNLIFANLGGLFTYIMLKKSR